jgi:hypothetical protein
MPHSALQANAFVTKAVDLDQFMQVVQAIDSFWLAVATLPGPSVGGRS